MTSAQGSLECISKVFGLFSTGAGQPCKAGWEDDGHATICTFRNDPWTLLQLAAHKPSDSRGTKYTQHPPGSHSPIPLSAGLNVPKTSCVLLLFFPTVSFMSQPTKVLTTSPTLAQNWHWTWGQQIERFSCVWCGMQLRFSHWARDEDKESVSLNSILAEILPKVYSFPSVKCTSFTQNTTQLLVFLCPPKKSKTTSRVVMQLLACMTVHAAIYKEQSVAGKYSGGTFCRWRRIPRLPFWVFVVLNRHYR